MKEGGGTGWRKEGGYIYNVEERDEEEQWQGNMVDMEEKRVQHITELYLYAVYIVQVSIPMFREVCIIQVMVARLSSLPPVSLLLSPPAAPSLCVRDMGCITHTHTHTPINITQCIKYYIHRSSVQERSWENKVH